MNFDQYKNEWSGRRVDYDHVYHYQCVDLILQYLHDCFGIGSGVDGNAIDYWHNPSQPLLAKFDKLQTTDVRMGDIVILNGLPGNPYGHIMISTGNQNGPQFEGLEQNGQNGDGDGGNADMNPKDTVPLNDGNQIRTRWVDKSRIAGLLRSKPVVAPPSNTVHPYTIEVIQPKQVTISRNTHKWGLNYDNITAMVAHPEGTALAGEVKTVVAICHHNIGYNYYLENATVASGYNVVDCNDVGPSAPVPPPAAVYHPNPPGALPFPHPTAPYVVMRPVKGYRHASDALNHTNWANNSIVPKGSYMVFSRAQGMINLTDKPGFGKWWINPADNAIAGRGSGMGYISPRESSLPVRPVILETEHEDQQNEVGTLSMKVVNTVAMQAPVTSSATAYGGTTYRTIPQQLPKRTISDRIAEWFGIADGYRDHRKLKQGVRR